MQPQAEDRIIVVPGGGITDRNLERILQGAGVKEFHCSARESSTSLMEYRTDHVFMGGALRPPRISRQNYQPNQGQQTYTDSKES
ncbi:hypothetical protein QZH41_000118 [Actinostola sp. cb2023]|nr:hypothetical protein QZH41_000118 [Actinostola sp. cb2023]